MGPSSAFDPAPFIRTFESAVDDLLAIRDDVQKKKDALEISVRDSERGFSHKISELNLGFEVPPDVRQVATRLTRSRGSPRQ